jgi:GNAT superfamily N-acetyltransferase
LRVVEEAAGQDVFPVMDAQGKMVGIVPVDVVRTLATERGVAALALADDLMVPAVWLRDDDDLHRALEVMLDAGLREVPVVDGAGVLVGLLDEADVAAFFERPVRAIYLEEQYRGCAILADAPFGAYLTKFATDPEARGEGIARDLWDTFRDAHPALAWRARAANPINEWYTKLADGLVKCPPWWVFWKGIDHGRIAEVIDFALAQPLDLPAPADAPRPEGIGQPA